MKSAFSRYFTLSLLLFLISFALLSLRLHLNPIISYLIAVNITGFFVFSFDKLAALKSFQRAPELLLHLIELFGATPAMLLAQQLFWHKSTKRSYQISFWLIVVLQIAVLYLIYYTDLLKLIF